MFRDIARKKQKLSSDDCIGLLKNEKRGVLSVIGDDGYPYGLPINHYYDAEDGKLYFHSGKTGHKAGPKGNDEHDGEKTVQAAADGPQYIFPSGLFHHRITTRPPGSEGDADSRWRI